MIDTPETKTDPRIYMAAERTFLAWMRTGIALMGFGFVLARFGLFLREMADSKTPIKLPHSGFSVPAGLALVLIGVAVIFTSAIRHYRMVRALDRGQFREKFGATFALSVAVLLGIIGVTVTLYLVLL